MEKAIKCLEKETGEVVNLDEMVAGEWKGRA